MGFFDLDAAELHALVELEFTSDANEGSGSKTRDDVRNRVRLFSTRVNQLSCATLVTEHNELHLLLVADGFHPPRD